MEANPRSVAGKLSEEITLKHERFKLRFKEKTGWFI